MDTIERDSPSPRRRGGCLGYLLFFAAALWVLLFCYGMQTGGWLVGQLLLTLDQPFTPLTWVIITWANGLILLLVVAPLAAFTRAPRRRATYRCWALAALALFPLALVRLVPETQTQAAALAQILVSLTLVALLAIPARRRGYSLGRSYPALLAATALVPLLVLPWVALGALGSPLDSLLNLMAGSSLGLLAGVLLDVYLVGPLTTHSRGTGRDVAFGGLSVGVTLAVLAAGFGFGGSQLLLLGALPPLGFAVMAIAHYAATPERPTGRAWLPVATLVGLAAAAPLIFFDPDEITLLLDMSDIPGWATRATGLSALLASLAGLVVGLLRLRQVTLPHPRTLAAIAAPGWVAALLVYLVVGQPGFYGEQLFVILRDQPELTQAHSIADRDLRVRYVYETLTGRAESSQAGLRATLDRFGIGYQPYYLVNALEVDAGPLVRLYLSRQQEVDRILDSPRLRPLPEPIPTSSGSESPPNGPTWNVAAIGADRVWNELGVTGSGIVVGQSDSGVQVSHPALRDGYRGQSNHNDYHWLDPWNGTTSPTDTDGHGTFTLGSAVGRGGIGVAPGAQWFGCVNLARNLGNPARYLDCMQFMLAPYPQLGDPFEDGDPSLAAHVTNNSWGCPPLEGCDPSALAPAVNALRAAGIFVATSAGNSGPGCGSVSDPIAIYQASFSVGAVDGEGNVADFSSRGPVAVDGSGRIKPDIVAPGVDVLSSYPGSSYTLESGTSAASPHVAGVVALMWSAQPRLIGDIESTERILRETARPYEGVREGCFRGGMPNAAYGYGLVDAYAAVKAALEMR